MRYLILLFILFAGSVFGQRKKVEKILNTYVNLDSIFFSGQDHFSDTMERINNYHHFDLENLISAANNYKHDRNGELYTDREFIYLKKQFADTRLLVIDAKKIRPQRTGSNPGRSIRFVTPLFYPGKNKAIISYRVVNCSRCSEGRTVYLEKENNKWVIKYELHYWVE